MIPVGRRLCVEREVEDSISPSGIIIPDSAVKSSNFGTVIAVGPRCKEDFEPGDEIVFVSRGAAEVKHEGKDVLVIKEEEVLAKVV